MVVMGNLPIIEVRINGSGPYRFGIETGAGFVVIAPALVTTLGLARTGGSDDLPEYTLGSITAGAATFKGVAVHAIATAQTEIDGVLGLPLYRQVLLTLDYQNRRVAFERGSLAAPDGRSILPLTRVGPFWGAPITIGGKPFTAVVDTRSTGAFGVVPAVAEQLAFDGPLTVVGRARGAAIAETEVRAGRLSGDIVIGAYTFPTPSISVRALPPGFPDEPLLGTQVLSQFTVTLDQQNARIRLARAGDTTITLGPRPGAGVPPAAAPTPSAVAEYAAYAGTYGVREVRIEGDTLILQREGGAPLRLVRTKGDEFTLEQVPSAIIRFVRDAAHAVVEIQVLNRDGQWESAKRTR